MPSKKLLKPLFASLLMGATLFSSNSDAIQPPGPKLKKWLLKKQAFQMYLLP